MKAIIRNIITSILTLEASLVLKKHKPKVIAVTGSVGKTTTKDAIYSVLKGQVHIRKNQKSYNSELGIPLTILGLDSGWDSPILWIVNIVKGFLVLFKKEYPDYLVLEAGVDRPGDMEIAGSLIRPHVVVYTALGTTPVHVEYFDSVEDVWNEKFILAKHLRKGGVVIYNADDENLKNYFANSDFETKTFGSFDTDIIFSTPEFMYKKNQPAGVQANFSHNEITEKLMLTGGIGAAPMYSLAGAITTGIYIGEDFKTLIKNGSEHQPTKGRMRILEGKNEITIIDDTYNASPIAAHNAVLTLDQLQVEGKKILVIGDMLELGEFSSDEHRKLGDQIAESEIDICVAVGLRSRKIVKAAIEKGMPEDSVFHTLKSVEVPTILDAHTGAGDCILFKASQGIRLEKAVEKFLKEPGKKAELLVRQDDQWMDR